MHHNSRHDGAVHHKAEELKHDIYDKARAIGDQIEHKLKDASGKMDELQEQMHHLSNDLVKTVREKPIMALGVAVACGFILGKLLK